MRSSRRTFWVTLFSWLAAVGWGSGLAQSAPRNVSLATPFSEVNLGAAVLLTGKARDDGSQLNFLFYVSTSSDPADKGTLIAEEAVSGCQSTLGCARRVEFQASAVRAVHFFALEVRDEASSRLSSKVAVEVSPIDEVDPPLAPTPMSCRCGLTEVAVDAGRPMNTAVGGETLQLEASAAVTAGGGGINPDFFEWSILDDGGLGADLVLEDADMKSARLITPDLTQDASVRLRFLANLSNCGCSDEQLVTVLADPPPQTDLAISITDGDEAVTEKGEIAYQLNVSNNGPESAPNVEVTSLIPEGTSFVAADASQGVCSSEGVDVVCLLGELAPDSSVGLTLTLRADADGDVINTAVVSSGADELDIGNNAAVEITPVEAIHELFFAQFGEGEGALFSQIILYNLDPERDSPATLFLRRDDGTALSVDLNGEAVNGEADILVPAGGLRVFRTDGQGEGIVVGSVTVESERPLAGVILFGGIVGLAGVGSSQELPNNTFIAPMEADQALGIRTGIAVINLTSNPTNLNLRLFNSEGAEVAAGQSDLASLGHRANFLDELIDSQSVDLLNFQGLLEVSADGPIAATVIQTRPGQFATMPVTPAFSAQTVNSALMTASMSRGAASEPDHPPLQTEPTPTVCACGASQASVDAGPLTSSVVGGRTLMMQGAASGPSSGGGGVTPGIVNWSVVADAGLGSNLLINDADKLTAILATPDIGQDAIVTVRLEAEFADCSCSDDRFITILGQAPPEADLALGKEDSQDPVTATREFEYEINIINRGPDTAENVMVTDPLPAGVELIAAQPTQGDCSLEGQTVNCSLGDIPAAGEAEIILTVRANQAGLIQNVVQATSSTSDPFPNDNAASENTLVRSLQTLFFAQFGEGEDALFSQILLYNLDRLQESQLSIELRQKDGQPISVDLNGAQVVGTLDTTIPAGGLRVFRTDGSGQLQSGSVRVFSDTSLAGVIVFGGVVGLAGVGSSAPLENGFLAPMESDLAVGTRTGVAIMNLEDNSVDLTLTLIDSEGRQLGSVMRTLMPQGQLAEFVDELFQGQAADLNSFEGLLQVESDGRIAATVIQTRPGQFATMPVSGQ
ncbi:MAG: DUF11 domain-containing protein [Acidobacteriota bacterium]